MKNEPKRIRVKCIASAKCPWRTYVSYSKQARGIQVKSFQEEHSCCVSFKNKLVNVAMIANHFEPTIKYHPKMKIKKIQRRVASELKVNVNFTRCKRARKLVNEKLVGNYKEEFALLREYGDELLDKNHGSTMKLSVDRVTPNSPLHFKRFYVCFDALRKGWKKGCKPILSLDGCFLKYLY